MFTIVFLVISVHNVRDSRSIKGLHSEKDDAKTKSLEVDREFRIISRTMNWLHCIRIWCWCINRSPRRANWITSRTLRLMRWEDGQRASTEPALNTVYYFNDVWLNDCSGEVQCDHDRVSFRPSYVASPRWVPDRRTADRLVLYHYILFYRSRLQAYSTGWVHCWIYLSTMTATSLKNRLAFFLPICPTFVKTQNYVTVQSTLMRTFIAVQVNYFIKSFQRFFRFE